MLLFLRAITLLSLLLFLGLQKENEYTLFTQENDGSKGSSENQDDQQEKKTHRVLLVNEDLALGFAHSTKDQTLRMISCISISKVDNTNHVVCIPSYMNGKYEYTFDKDSINALKTYLRSFWGKGPISKPIKIAQLEKRNRQPSHTSTHGSSLHKPKEVLLYLLIKSFFGAAANTAIDTDTTVTKGDIQDILVYELSQAYYQTNFQDYIANLLQETITLLIKMDILKTPPPTQACYINNFADQNVNYRCFDILSNP